MPIPNQTPSYPNPPIVEAVFAFHFCEPLSVKTLERFGRRLKKRFPAQEQMFSVKIDAANVAKSSNRNYGVLNSRTPMTLAS